MANNTIAIEICAPEGKPVSFAATEVIVPGEAGVFTVLPGHTPFLTTIIPGVIIAYNGETPTHYYAVSGGFAEVRNDKLKIMADLFEEGEQIDPKRAEAARERAEQRLKTPDNNVDVQRAEWALHKAIARIGAHGREGF